MKKKTLIITSLSILAVVAVVMFVFNCIKLDGGFNALPGIIDEFKNDSDYIDKINYYSAINNIISSFAYVFFSIALGWLSIYSIIKLSKHNSVQNKFFMMFLVVILLAMLVVSNISSLIYQIKYFDCLFAGEKLGLYEIVFKYSPLPFALIYLALAVLGVVYLCRKKTPEEIEAIKQKKQAKKKEVIKKLQEKIDQIQKTID